MDLIKGAIRGVTADAMGAPVDMATVLANLAIAGGGYAAHKLGLIKQPPDLIDPKDVPLSSDWHVKNSPLQDTGSAAYTAGRFTGNVLPGILRAAASAPKPVHGQVNALYPGGRDDLLLTHATGGRPVRDMTHMSAAITKDTVPDAFGDIAYVLNPRRFDPKTSPSTLINRDFYSPRRMDSWEAIEGRNADTRMKDRWGANYVGSGRLKEGTLPGTDFAEAKAAPLNSHGFAITEAPRFTSFEHYERSPLGAATLVKGIPPEKVSSHIMARVIRQAMDDPQLLESMREVASHNRLDIERNYNREKVLGKLWSENPALFSAAIRKTISQFREVPSEYAEVKRWGSTPINADTVKGVLLRRKDDQNITTLDNIEDAGFWAKKRGIPVLEYTPEQVSDVFPAAVELQNRAWRR